MTTIIAKNQTVGALALSQIPVPNGVIPAGVGSTVTLTDYAAVSEIQDDADLLAHITAGDAIINDGATDLTQAKSIAMVSSVTSLTTGNAIGEAVVDAKGDLLAATAADAIVRLAVGADTHVLTADSTEPSGLRWAAGAGGSTIIVQDDGSSIANTPHGTLNFVGISAADSGGGVAAITFTGTAAFASYYNSASYQGITTSASTLPLDTTQHGDAAFTLASNEITINAASTYRVDYDLSLDESSTSDTTIDMWLEVNASEVGGSRARMFHDSNNEEGGNHGMAILTLAATDVLRIRAQVVSGSSQTDTLANGTRFLIQTIGADGADGATGPQGPTGSGSDVIIEDEGSSIANTPHSNLNFTGAGVTATDGGAGVATITISGGAGAANIAQYRQTGNLTINTTATTVVLNANDFEDSCYTRSGENITINTAGAYRVSYNVYFDTNANARRTVDAWVENNTVEIVPSRSASYSRNTSDDTASSGATFLVQLAASDVVRLRAQSTGTSGTAIGQGNRMWILLECVRTP